jgi:hypothetical protein
MTDDLRGAMERDAEIDELRDALRKAQRAASKKERNLAELVGAVYTAAHDAALAHGPAPKIAAPKLGRTSKRAEVALLHLTDWQIGKRTESFSMETCRQRIELAATKTVELTDLQRSHHPVTECHVMLGGDMVEGANIFAGQAFEIEPGGVFAQLMACAGLIESTVALLLEHFTTVHVWEEIGNHGRIGRKGDHPHGDNIDRMAYTMARQRCEPRAPGRLVWHPYGGDIGTHVAIGNYTAFLFHGDEINSFGGNTPAFGILRKLNAWASGVIAPFVDAYGGHFHTPMSLTMANAGRIFMTGSPESDNGYAKEFVAAVGKPSQRLNFVDPDKGRVSAEYVLWLAD